MKNLKENQKVLTNKGYATVKNIFADCVGLLFNDGTVGVRFEHEIQIFRHNGRFVIVGK